MKRPSRFLSKAEERRFAYMTARAHAHNPMCDGDQCRSSTGEVRILPTGGGGNVIICRDCFDHEIAWRKDRNREVASEFDLPTWDSLKVYEP